MISASGIAVTSFFVGLSGAMMPGPVLTVTIGETAARLKNGGPVFARSAPGLAPPGSVALDPLGAMGHEALARGALVGPLIVLGHGVLEVCLVAAIVMGFGKLLVLTPVMGGIGVLGGVVLLWMAWGMFRDVRGLTLQTASAATGGRNPVLSGILTSLSNPYWAVWWATIGLGYIALSMQLGFAGLVAFYFGHILSDLVWYSAVSLSLAMGHRLLTDRVYRGLVAVCAGFLVVFGLYFGFVGIRALAA